MNPAEAKEPHVLRRRRRRRVIEALAAAVAGVVLAGLGVLAFIESGVFNVAASVPHHPIVFWALDTTKKRSVKRHAAGIEAPVRFMASDVEAGFRIYEARCVACHGAPGLPPGPPGVGLNPPPPYLIDAPRRWKPNEIYWIVRNGEKMTGMPAWERELSPQETWDVVGFIEALRRTTYADYLAMRRSAAAPTG